MYPRDNKANWDENAFSLQFNNGPDTPHGLKQILASSRLTQVVSDPKKVKRMEANRNTAKRLREKKLRYLFSLEEKVKILEEEKASVCSKISILEEKIKVLMNDNKELKKQVDVTKYLQAKIQRLKEKLALKEQLKVATGEQMQNLYQSDLPNMQFMNSNINQFNDQQPKNPDYFDPFGISSIQSMSSNMFHQANNDQFNQ